MTFRHTLSLLMATSTLCAGPALAQKAPASPVLRVNPSSTATSAPIELQDGSGRWKPIGTLNPTTGDFVPNGLPAVQALASSAIADAPYVTATDALFGAKCDGRTDDTAALRKASSMAGGRIVQLPAGAVCMVDNFTLSDGDSFRGGHGSAGLTILRRMPNSTSAMVLGGSAANVSLIDLKIDGNRANETVGANNIALRGLNNLLIQGVRSYGAKGVAGTLGDGLFLSGGTDAAALTTTRVLDSSFSDNDGNGIDIQGATNVQINRFDASRNGQSGVIASRFVYPPSSVMGANDNLSVTDGTASSNGGSGVAVASFIAGGSSARPIWGVEAPTARYGRISGVRATGNKGYGLVWQGNYGTVSNNVVSSNGTSGNAGSGGVLFNAGYSTIGGNTIDHNLNFGIDAGGCVQCTILPNTYVENGTELDVGGTISTSVSLGSMATSGLAVLVVGTESAGAGSAFEYVSSGLSIDGGSIQLNSPTARGIFLWDGADNISVHNVQVSGGSCGNGFWFHGGNQADGSFALNHGGNVEQACGLTPNYVGANTITIPSAGTNFRITAGSTVFFIQTTSSAFYLGKMRWVRATAPGLYDPNNPPNVSFTAGSCYNPPSGSAIISNAGKFLGVSRSNDGAAYCTAANPPVMTISGGPSSYNGVPTGGGAGMALIGENDFEGRTIGVHLDPGAILQTGGNLLLATSNVTGTTPGGCEMTLKGSGGAWSETARRC